MNFSTSTSWGRKVKAAGGVAIVCMLVGLGLLGCGGSKGEGATPEAPQDVVQAYVDRLSAGQPDEARVFLTETAQSNGGAPIGSGRISDFRMREPTAMPSKSSNGRAVADAVTIWTDFTRSGESDPTLNNGPASWAFILVKEQPDSQWKIDDQGLG